VLRKLADRAPAAWANRKPSRLPDWLRDPLVMAWTDATVTGLEAAHAKGAPLDLTPAKPELAEPLSKQLDAQILPTGSLRIDRPVQVSTLPGFEAGSWWVQDAAAAIPAQVLDPKPGETILDLCAAPGGKTLQLASAGANVTAVDISAARTERIAENLQRTNLRAKMITQDAFDMTDTGWDAVLLDAPCSATGTIRRHPDLPYAQDGSGISELIDLQMRMIDHAIGLLKPGGRLVYCTCSLIPDEGEVQVEEALTRHPGLTTDRDALTRPGIDPAWITSEGGLRLRPDYWADQGGMDGFYIAMLRKPA
jgi:16S rRNA (cytosine967-C5)-methyltransferase